MSGKDYPLFYSDNANGMRNLLQLYMGIMGEEAETTQGVNCLNLIGLSFQATAKNRTWEGKTFTDLTKISKVTNGEQTITIGGTTVPLGVVPF
jgi:hypothetical protein